MKVEVKTGKFFTLGNLTILVREDKLIDVSLVSDIGETKTDRLTPTFKETEEEAIEETAKFFENIIQELKRK